jgi:hypothetical protein
MYRLPIVARGVTTDDVLIVPLLTIPVRLDRPLANKVPHVLGPRLDLGEFNIVEIIKLEMDEFTIIAFVIDEFVDTMLPLILPDVDTLTLPLVTFKFPDKMLTFPLDTFKFPDKMLILPVDTLRLPDDKFTFPLIIPIFPLVTSRLELDICIPPLRTVTFPDDTLTFPPDTFTLPAKTAPEVIFAFPPIEMLPEVMNTLPLKFAFPPRRNTLLALVAFILPLRFRLPELW